MGAGTSRVNGPQPWAQAPVRQDQPSTIRDRGCPDGYDECQRRSPPPGHLRSRHPRQPGSSSKVSYRRSHPRPPGRPGRLRTRHQHPAPRRRHLHHGPDRAPSGQHRGDRARPQPPGATLRTPDMSSGNGGLGRPMANRLTRTTAMTRQTAGGKTVSAPLARQSQDTRGRPRRPREHSPIPPSPLPARTTSLVTREDFVGTGIADRRIGAVEVPRHEPAPSSSVMSPRDVTSRALPSASS